MKAPEKIQKALVSLNSILEVSKKTCPASVAVVSPGLLPVPPVLGGSVETVIQKMAEVTQSRFNIDIYGPTNRFLPDRETKGNISYYRFPSRPYPEYFKTVRAQINKKNYSIIQVENRPLFIPGTKALNPQSKFICSLHSLDHIAPKLIGSGLTRKIFQQCDRILVYSKFISNRLAEMFPRISGRVRFIHLAVDAKRFRPRWDLMVQNRVKSLRKKLGIPDSHKIILFAGRLIPKKGVEILLSAMEYVLQNYPQCYLLIVGSDWFGNRVVTNYVKGLRQQARKIGPKVIFTNYVSNHKLPLYFAMADIFVCPSQWDEPFGLVNVEAMASGVPVVASARGGIPEIITDGVNGFLVRKEEDPHSFVIPLLKLLNNPDLAGSFGRNGRRAVEEYFNWSRAGSQLAELYAELVQSKFGIC